MQHGVAEHGTLNDVYPFLVLCHESITTGEAPKIDNAKLARQKRRRTSREDQATLEAAYHRDPKPDKRARLAIVNTVSLGEKEVQIWFQNRRQNTRRRSRPLLPHEIAAFGLEEVVPTSSDNSSILGGSQNSSMQTSYSQPVSDQERASLITVPETSPRFSRSSSVPIDPVPRLAVNENTECHFEIATPSTAQPTSSSISDVYDMSRSPVSRPILSCVTQVGYLANRWNTAQGPSCLSTRPGSRTKSPRSSITSGSTAFSDSTVATSVSSKIRLSMSLDGKAELVARGISPPLPKLARSSSAGSTVPSRSVDNTDASRDRLCPDHAFTQPVPTSACLTPRLSQGRSRDARTWEFCCDVDAQDELTTHAEHESSGSAVAAISLLRSTNHKASISNNDKQKLMDRQPLSKRTKMGRAHSSLARLQGESNAIGVRAGRNAVSPPVALPATGDSDKENWSPNRSDVISQSDRYLSRAPSDNPPTRSAPRARAGHKIGPARPSILAETVRNRRHKKEDCASKDVNAVASTDVARFMKGEISPSKKGDFDCVQGLLSLSQGNWR